MRAERETKQIIFNHKIYDLEIPICPACKRYVATLKKCPNCGMKIEHEEEKENV